MKNKKLIFFTGLAFFPALFAHAETANVNVYGTLNLSFESVSGAGAANPAFNYVNRFRLASNSSNFGIKGSEDISESLKAFFQVESALSMESGSGTLAGRNSAVGLSGGFGTLLAGVWDTPFKLANSFIEPFYSTGTGYLASVLDLIGRGSSSSTFASAGGATDAAKISFNRRQGNSLQYWSPAFGGVVFKAAYSANLDRGAATGNPDLLSASLAYSGGPVDAAFAYEQHDDFGGRAVLPYAGSLFNTKDIGLKAAVGYKLFEGLTLGASWTNLAYNAYSDAGKTSYSRDAFAITALHKMDAWTFRLGLGKAGAGSCTKADASACSTADLGAGMGTLGASYSLGKRTDIYGLVSKIWNEAAASYNFAVSGLSTVSTTVSNYAGADPQAVALGIRHAF